jgi:prepilin peptidase dependent protein B
MLAAMTRGRAARPQRGLSLIEMLVGLALGLVLVSFALLGWALQVRETRHLLLETRLMQDLRTTADLMSRNLRRAGHWAGAPSGVWQGDGADLRSNPHAHLELAADKVTFSHSPPDARDIEPAGLGQLGYRLRQGVIEMQMNSGAWQSMTDAGTMVVTAIDLSAETVKEPLGGLCTRACPASAGDTCPPTQEVRRVALHIRAASARDASVTRELQSSVRLRNDTLLGACPP